MAHLAANMGTLWSFGPRVIQHHGLGRFAIIWIGSSVCGGLLQVYYWTQKTESPNFIRKAIGAFCSVSGLMASFACAEPTRRVIYPLVPIRVPALFNIMGLVLFSLAAFQNGWLPLVRHLGHFGGIFFGAFWWLVL